MKCKNCGAESKNVKFCPYCGNALEGAEIFAMQVHKTYMLTGRGFMVNGIAKIQIKQNDTVKNSRTGKSFAVLYVVNNKFKMLKSAEVEQECTICLSGASLEDFEPGDNLVV